jgi:hypothetical protein
MTPMEYRKKYQNQWITCPYPILLVKEYY